MDRYSVGDFWYQLLVGWVGFSDHKGLLGLTAAWAQGHQHSPAEGKGRRRRPPGGQAGTGLVAAPTVEIPLDKQKLIGLKTTAVGLQSLTKTIRTVGRIESDERRQAYINIQGGRLD